MKRSVLSAAVLAASILPAAAQPLPPPGGGPAPPRPARGYGYNCEAAQPGFFGGAQPFACPLPGRRPLGAACSCPPPAAAFSPALPPLLGTVVP